MKPRGVSASPSVVTIRCWSNYALIIRLSSGPIAPVALQLAGEWMDEAAVSTIHGWCYRMLREHAFDSGSLFTPDAGNR